MGIQGQNQVLYLSKQLQLAQVIAVLNDKVRSTGDITRQPCVVIDANQAAMNLLHLPGRVMNHVCTLARTFALQGIRVIVAADGNCRPQTKIASTEHAAKRERARITALNARQKLSELLKTYNPPLIETEQLEEIASSNEKKSSNILPMDFIDVLRVEVNNLATLNLPATVTFKVAEMQADPMVACLLIDGTANAIVSSDSNFAAYMGEKCLCI